ncbi:MAG: 50S ribosomal protein L30e [Candidatus Micrarchaeota archaeon]
MVDINKAIRMAVDTGKVEFGARGTAKKVARGAMKGIVIASNCPNEVKEEVERSAKMAEILVYVYEGTSLELGSLCGKPFPVAVLGIFDEGNSNVLEALVSNPSSKAARGKARNEKKEAVD